jgi:hypothetical protein
VHEGLKLEGFLKMGLRIGINSKVSFGFKVRFLMQYEWMMMSCNMSDLYVPHQTKRLPIIDGVRTVGGKSHSIP